MFTTTRFSRTLCTFKTKHDVSILGSKLVSKLGSKLVSNLACKPSRLSRSINLTTSSNRRNIHNVKFPRDEEYVAVSEHRRLQREIVRLNAEVREKEGIIEELRGSRQQKDMHIECNGDAVGSDVKNSDTEEREAQDQEKDRGRKVEGIQNTKGGKGGVNLSIWTGGLTDTDGFGWEWKGVGWNKGIERKQGRMRELMEGMSNMEREKYDVL